jgi:hypothetical protein
MGRTYKRNDLHNSRRPKSIREKRQYSGSKRDTYYDDNSTDFSTGKYQRTDWIDDILDDDFDQFDDSDYEIISEEFLGDVS